MILKPRTLTVFSFALLLTAVLAASAGETGIKRDPRPTPMMSSVEPSSGRIGDVMKVSGVNLDASLVRELYMTAGGLDVKVEITEQTATVIRFKIPAEAKPGRYCLTVLTTEEPPRLLEQPGAYLTVTEGR